MSEWGAALYVSGRVLFLPLYALGVRWLRTLSWNLATLGLVLVGAQLMVQDPANSGVGYLTSPLPNNALQLVAAPGALRRGKPMGKHGEGPSGLPGDLDSAKRAKAAPADGGR